MLYSFLICHIYLSDNPHCSRLTARYIHNNVYNHIYIYIYIMPFIRNYQAAMPHTVSINSKYMAITSILDRSEIFTMPAHTSLKSVLICTLLSTYSVSNILSFQIYIFLGQIKNWTKNRIVNWLAIVSVFITISLAL